MQLSASMSRMEGFKDKVRLHPSNSTEIMENPIFTMWLDGVGILCLVSKKHPPQTIEDTKKLFADIRTISHGKKRCMLMDLTNFQMPGKESRDYGAVELPNLVTAIAFLSGSALGAFVANTFFTVWQQPYPTRMFTKENKAREWLTQYL